MKWIFQWLVPAAGVLAWALVSGCALTKDQVALSYSAQTNVSKVGEAGKIFVTVKVNDERTDKSAVGAKINGLGMEMAPIVASGDVAALVQSAIETELTDRGFELTVTNGVNIVADLSAFRNQFKVGFWSGDALAEVIMDVTVKNQSGQIVYAKLVAGQGKNANIQLASGSNAKFALDAALKDAMDKMFGDKAFIDALLKPAHPT